MKEVLLHEFLHSLERTAQEYGYEIPALHDFEKYGYKNERLIGERTWYQDYINKTIKDSSGNLIGLPEEVYTLKPAKNSNFKYSYSIEEFKQPENFIEEMKELVANIIKRIQAQE